jgi:transposase
VSNDVAGWTELVEWLRGFSIVAIGIEASGGYERGVVRALLAAGMSVRQVNPFKLRQFAKASGVLAKSDPLDARMIASFVAIMPTRPVQRPAPAVEQLAGILAVRRQLSDEKGLFSRSAPGLRSVPRSGTILVFAAITSPSG